MKSSQAKCASAIRKELKVAFPNSPFRVKSRSFAGGNSVDIYIGSYEETGEVDQWGGKIMKRCDKMKKAREIVAKYQYGHFDGMTDMYEYTNTRDDIPQAKYVHVNPYSHA